MGGVWGSKPPFCSPLGIKGEGLFRWAPLYSPSERGREMG